MFLYRSANVGNKKIVNIVYVPPAAAVSTRTQKPSVIALFRDLKRSVSRMDEESLEHTYNDQKR
jgi:hypothetical protein